MNPTLVPVLALAQKQTALTRRLRDAGTAGVRVAELVGDDRQAARALDQLRDAGLLRDLGRDRVALDEAALRERTARQGKVALLALSAVGFLGAVAGASWLLLR